MNANKTMDSLDGITPDYGNMTLAQLREIKGEYYIKYGDVKTFNNLGDAILQAEAISYQHDHAIIEVVHIHDGIEEPDWIAEGEWEYLAKTGKLPR